jgi:phytoene dehydrogenase-like protein
MDQYDDIVVGSGISGMTMALILGMNGRKVLLLEKAPVMGGSVSRFSRGGVPFDTGFHFTGGLQPGGLLSDMLRVLEIDAMIEPVFLAQEQANCFFIESEQKLFEIPYGMENVQRRYKEYFPGEERAISRYFEMVQHVCRGTPSMDLRTLISQQGLLDEDFRSLQEVLDGLTDNGILKALLSGFAMCYGVRPDEVSFAAHSRVCQGLYQSVARVRKGGSAFIAAFRQAFRKYDIDVRCGTGLAGVAGISGRTAQRFVLDNGDEVGAEHCVLTIHPKAILNILPGQLLSKAFRDRISSFESSCGFFSVFAVVDDAGRGEGFGSSIYSIFPHSDINRMLDPSHSGRAALVIVRSTEQAGGRTYQVVNAFEPSFMEQVDQWKTTKTGRRPSDYGDYKKHKTDDIAARIVQAFPEYKDTLKVMEAASVLTFRDYLNSPDGSAYGIKQKVRQVNLLGKLPVHNMYAAGQSSLLPGIIGAMMSSFITGRAILDESRYRHFLLRNLNG